MNDWASRSIMLYSCEVSWCQNTNTDGDNSISFYHIPLEEERRNLWIAALNIEDLSPQQLTNITVCSQHFVSGKSSSDPNDIDYVPSVLNSPDNENQNHKKKRRKLDNEMSSSDTEEEDDDICVVEFQSEEEDAGVTDVECNLDLLSENVKKPDGVEMIEMKEEVREVEKDDGPWIGVRVLQQLVEVAERAKKLKQAAALKEATKDGANPTIKTPQKIAPASISGEEWSTAISNINVYLVQMYCCKFCNNKFGSMSQPAIVAHMKEAHGKEWDKAMRAKTSRRTQNSKPKRRTTWNKTERTVMKSTFCSKTSDNDKLLKHPTIHEQKSSFPSISFKHGFTLVNKVEKDELGPNITKTTQIQGEGKTVTTYKLGSSASTSNNEAVVCKHCNETCKSMQDYWIHCHKKHLLTDVSQLK